MTTENNSWSAWASTWKTTAPSSITNPTTIVPPIGFRGGLAQYEDNTNDEMSGIRGDLINDPNVQLSFCILYTTVFVLGVFGNVLVCYVVLRNRAMQTVTNIFITNLAVSDILLCILAVPFTPLYTFMGRWIFGRTLCHLVSYAQGCCIYVSSLTLTSIAVDRLLVICFPFKLRMSISLCCSIIFVIWGISVVATLPYGRYMKVTEVAMYNGTDLFSVNFTKLMSNESIYNPYPNKTAAVIGYIQMMNAGLPLPPEVAVTAYCEENWPTESYRRWFGSCTAIIQFIIPFAAISACYLTISRKLNARSRCKPGSKSVRRDETDTKRKRKTNRMLVAMVLVFAFSWMPMTFVNIYDDFFEESSEWEYYTFLFFVTHSLAMSSTCYNPFLYAWLNENFRKEFKHVLPCFNPSNNNVLNISRGFNRSDRNTCGPRLHIGNGEGGQGGGSGRRGRGGSVNNEDNDENGITQESSVPREKLLIIPREPTYGNGSMAAVSPVLGAFGFNTALVHNNNQQVDILLNDRDLHRNRRQTDDESYIDSGDEQTVEVRFSETPFVSSDNATGISMLEPSTSRQSTVEVELIPELSKPTTSAAANGGQLSSN